jgi:plasmid replication initiation protein
MPVDDLHKAPHVRGRPFEKGNGGRKSGAKNRTTLVAHALLRGEEVELVRKAIELAKAGDIQMLKFLLDRILPRDRTLQLDFPVMEHASDAPDVLAAITEAVRSGRIAPSEASALATVVGTYARVQHVAELQERLELVERRLREL